MIPKIIHLLWFGDKPLPDAYRKNYDRWLLLTAETEWQVRLWTDQNCPMSELLSVVSPLDVSLVQICDCMRLAILYACGGIYADIDIIPLRLPVFDDDDRLNLFRDIDGDKNYTLTNSVIAAPMRCKQVDELLFKTLQSVKLGAKTRDDILSSGANAFMSFPEPWYDAIAFRSNQHFSPVSWPQARVLNIGEHYTYDQWLTLAESFLKHENVYGVHTFDSTWVYLLNDKIMNG